MNAFNFEAALSQLMPANTTLAFKTLRIVIATTNPLS